MSPNQRTFKLLSLALMGLGMLAAVIGVLVATSSSAAGIFHVSLSASSGSGPLSDEALGVAAAVVGVWCLVVGTMGSLTANSPRDVGRFKVAGISLVAVALVVAALGAASSELLWLDVVVAVAGIADVTFAVRANHEVIDKL